MSGVQKAIFPGILLSSLFIFFLNKTINPLNSAVAATELPVVEDTREAVESQPEERSCTFQERYPPKVVQWCGLIEEMAEEYGIDPLLVAAVMLMESGGQPEIMSHSGAVGLMQIMPRDGIAATFQCINGPCFSSRPTIEELKDPEFNVEFGVRMLSGLARRHGNMRDALKSYGPYDVSYDYADKVLAIYNSL